MQEFMYVWVIDPELEKTSIAAIVQSLLEVLYASYPHQIDLHLTLSVEFLDNLQSQEVKTLKVAEFDFSQDLVPKKAIKSYLRTFFSFLKAVSQDIIITKVSLVGVHL